MADQHVFTDQCGIAVRRFAVGAVAVDDAAILNIAARADDDPADVGAQHAVIPDADIGADGDIADNPASRSDKGAVVNLRRFPIDRNDRDIGACNHLCAFQINKCGNTDA